jgi:hypothetical protein
LAAAVADEAPAYVRTAHGPAAAVAAVAVVTGTVAADAVAVAAEVVVAALVPVVAISAKVVVDHTHNAKGKAIDENLKNVKVDPNFRLDRIIPQ